ncbi:MAG: hypothetical protein ABJ275_07655 [Maricaulaceae bacterium]
MKFSEGQTLEARLKQVRLVTRLMYLGQAVFLTLAFLNYKMAEPFLGMRDISYAFAFIAIFQFILVKFILAPLWERKAHEGL